MFIPWGTLGYEWIWVTWLCSWMAGLQGVRRGEVTGLFSNAPHREMHKRQVARTHGSPEHLRSVLSFDDERSGLKRSRTDVLKTQRHVYVIQQTSISCFVFLHQWLNTDGTMSEYLMAHIKKFNRCMKKKLAAYGWPEELLTHKLHFDIILKKLWELLTHIKLVDMTAACSGWLLWWCYVVGANITVTDVLLWLNKTFSYFKDL